METNVASLSFDTTQPEAAFYEIIKLTLHAFEYFRQRGKTFFQLFSRDS